ncbi:MAG TPA: methylenetetrahydrofolate reductase, partial [Xanthobacteraceae bacterium]|nr:methylenetetrahydrofolate reductase [Xanthobacteraceae bacterium]
GLEEDAATRKLIAAAVAAEQVLDLVDQGVSDFHFYTMNRADLVYAVCHLLGLRPASPGKEITDAEGRDEAVQQGTPSPRRGEGRGEGVTVAPGTTSAAS